MKGLTLVLKDSDFSLEAVGVISGFLFLFFFLLRTGLGERVPKEENIEEQRKIILIKQSYVQSREKN